LSWPGKKQSRADFPFKYVWIPCKIFPNTLLKLEISSAGFLDQHNQKQTALIETSYALDADFPGAASRGSYQVTPQVSIQLWVEWQLQLMMNPTCCVFDRTLF